MNKVSKKNAKKTQKRSKNNPKHEKNVPALFSGLLDQPPIDKTDMKLLSLLQRNARMTNIDIADRLNTSEATVRRRINNLVDRGYIRSFSALLDYKLMGNAVKAHVIAKVDKDSLDEVANNLKKSQNVHTLCQVIGEHNLLCELIFNNILELQEFTDNLSENDKVEDMEYYIVTRSFKTCPWSGL
jgi:DNA-binding Lrp family transcriptional regulator